MGVNKLNFISQLNQKLKSQSLVSTGSEILSERRDNANY